MGSWVLIYLCIFSCVEDHEFFEQVHDFVFVEDVDSYAVLVIDEYVSECFVFADEFDFLAVHPESFGDIFEGDHGVLSSRVIMVFLFYVIFCRVSNFFSSMFAL